MQVSLDAWDATWRVLAAMVAASLIGLDRGEHGENAGLRTTLLVCLASTMSMLLANALLGATGKAADSFVNMDVMRLPLGILTGIGFIGAGAIVRRGSQVRGVTTAATMWFVTVMGLCFGAGRFGLGGTMAGTGLLVLQTFKVIDRRLKTRHRARLKVCVRAEADRSLEPEILARLRGFAVSRWAVRHRAEVLTEYSGDARWMAREDSPRSPDCLEEIRALDGVVEVAWEPRR